MPPKKNDANKKTQDKQKAKIVEVNIDTSSSFFQHSLTEL